MVTGIKHMAVAVSDVDAAVRAYEQRLGVTDPRRVEWEQGQSKEAHFAFGDVEIQLCESTDPDGPLRAAHRPVRRRGPAHLPLRREHRRRDRPGACGRSDAEGVPRLPEDRLPPAQRGLGSVPRRPGGPGVRDRVHAGLSRTANARPISRPACDHAGDAARGGCRGRRRPRARRLDELAAVGSDPLGGHDEDRVLAEDAAAVSLVGRLAAGSGADAGLRRVREPVRLDRRELPGGRDERVGIPPRHGAERRPLRRRARCRRGDRGRRGDACRGRAARASARGRRLAMRGARAVLAGEGRQPALQRPVDARPARPARRAAVRPRLGARRRGPAASPRGLAADRQLSRASHRAGPPSRARAALGGSRDRGRRADPAQDRRHRSRRPLRRHADGRPPRRTLRGGRARPCRRGRRPERGRDRLGCDHRTRDLPAGCDQRRSGSGRAARGRTRGRPRRHGAARRAHRRVGRGGRRASVGRTSRRRSSPAASRPCSTPRSSRR